METGHGQVQQHRLGLNGHNILYINVHTVHDGGKEPGSIDSCCAGTIPYVCSGPVPVLCE